MKLQITRYNNARKLVDIYLECHYFTIQTGVISLFNENESLPFKAIKDWLHMERVNE